jgi:hypothetical protein
MTLNTSRYCLVIGNTGFRESALYEKIEYYLLLLEAFHLQGFSWQHHQKNFFKMMKEAGLMEQGSTSERNAPKAARLKTSPLEKLGLIDTDRRITEVGQQLLERSKLRQLKKNVEFDDAYFLDNDGDLYMKQLVKLHFYANVDDKLGIRPFVLLLDLMMTFNGLTKTELAYIVPLIITDHLVEDGKAAIRDYRRVMAIDETWSSQWVKDHLIKHKDKLSNIQTIKNNLKTHTYELETAFELNQKEVINHYIIEMDDNGKSKSYSLKMKDMISGLYHLWKATKEGQKQKCHKAIREVLGGIEKTSTTQQKEWRKLIFGVTNKSSLKSLTSEKLDYYHGTYIGLFHEETFEAYILKILDMIWYIKLLNNLKDYEDHNTRYFKLSGVFETTYRGNEKALKISDFYKKMVEKIIAKEKIEPITYDKIAYKQALYSENYSLPQLDEADSLQLAKEFIDSTSLKDVMKEMKQPESMNSKEWLNHLKKLHRLHRINDMIKEIKESIIGHKPGNLIDCLELIKNRQDKQLKEFMDTEADIPTLFEYLLWQTFLVLGDYVGDPLAYANFSFDNDLKPVLHAGGGLADVIYSYHDHDVILEATLTKDENQRKLEMEPVPRHLAKHRHEIRDMAYCIFVAPIIDPNVAIVHRSFRQLPYYIKDQATATYVPIEEMSILPLGIDELKALLKYSVLKRQSYNQLRQQLFKPLIRNEALDGYLWYTQVIQPAIHNLGTMDLI